MFCLLNMDFQFSTHSSDQRETILQKYLTDITKLTKHLVAWPLHFEK